MAIASLMIILSFSAKAEQSGIVYFKGSIVEPTCQINYNLYGLDINCSKNRKDKVNSNDYITSHHVEYLDDTKRIVLVHVSYR